MLRKFRIISDEKLQIVRAKPTVKGVDASPAAKQQIAEDKALRISTAMTLRLWCPRSDSRVDATAPTRCPTIMNVRMVASSFFLSQYKPNSIEIELKA